jgi:hypothetical protein
MTLHEYAIECLCRQIPYATNNHYLLGKGEYKVGGYIPDIVVRDQNNEVKELHEVETLSIRTLPDLNGIKKILWVVLETEGWDEIREVTIKRDTLQNIQNLEHYRDMLEERVRSLQSLLEELANAKTQLQNEAEKEKLHLTELREKNKIILLYQLPLFKFQELLKPDECLLCPSVSHMIIDAGKVGRYGLCHTCFEKLLALDNKPRELKGEEEGAE